jgi:hypothetical protein
MTINVVMNQLLAHQPNYASRPGLCTGLGCEDPLRVVAADIAEEFGLETRVGMHVGSFSVRFSRQNGQ